MNTRMVKQIAGIDVAQKELVVTIGRMDESWTAELYGYKVFPNTAKGFALLLDWVKNKSIPDLPFRFVMEATGVYHESLAYYLDEQQQAVTIVLPNKISNYARTLDIKTVTDKTASEAICRFGLERKLSDWKRPHPVYKRLRQLTRERDQVIQSRTVAKNQLHAETSEAEPYDQSIARINQQIALLDKQEKQIKEEIADMIKQYPEIKAVVELLCSVPGIGVLTAVTILGETNGFELVRNKRQISSYAGLDIQEKQSGTSVKGKPRISKRGNKHLRKSLHLPALAAIRHCERFKAIFTRLVSKHGIKMKAAVAIQRKLLEIVYTVFKTKCRYDNNYLNKHHEIVAHQ